MTAEPQYSSLIGSGVTSTKSDECQTKFSHKAKGNES